MSSSDKTGATAIESAEFKLAVECCRRCFRESAARDDSLASAEIDWDHFLRLVRFHRIEGLVWNALAGAQMPEPASQQLKTAASAIAAENLRSKTECRSLLERFERAKIPLLFLKGLTVGALAYGNPAIKSAIDIDLLVDHNNLNEAAELLRKSGYELVLPRNEARLQPWHRRRKESVWAKPGTGQQIDLHTRTADNPRLIPSVTVKSNDQFVGIGDGVVLKTLADEQLFSYLAVHGASSAWFRLKWIADFAGLLHGRDPAEIERMYRRSQDLHAARAAGQALLLADALFATLSQSQGLLREIRSDRTTSRLFKAALRQLSGDPIEPTDRRFGTFRIHWTQFLLLPGVGYKWSELFGQLARALARSS